VARFHSYHDPYRGARDHSFLRSRNDRSQYITIRRNTIFVRICETNTGMAPCLLSPVIARQTPQIKFRKCMHPGGHFEPKEKMSMYVSDNCRICHR
jgi:hypothetical protein